MADYASFREENVQPIVYVRTVRVEDLPDQVQGDVGDLKSVYAVSSEEGQVLALVDDRERAFLLARMNEMQPVSVH